MLLFIVSFVFASVLAGIIAIGRFSSLARVTNDLRARQASHSEPTSRLGGLAILVSVTLVSLPGETISLVSCALPLFLIGLLEDIGHHQSPRRRLMIAGISGILVILVADIYIERLGVPELDPLLSITPFAIAFTLFATVGVSHAFNLIDGLNGLSGMVTTVTAVGLLSVSIDAEHAEDIPLLLALLGATLGFLIFNFPLGKIFLGDAGAYCIGFLLAWIAVDLMHAVPTLSPWAVALIFFWPVADTLFAIWRRLMRGQRLDHPDRMHFHQVVLRALEITVIGRRRRSLANPISTMVILPLMVVPVAAGTLLWDQNGLAAAAFLSALALYVASYRLLIWIARSRLRLPPRAASRASAVSVQEQSQ